MGVYKKVWNSECWQVTGKPPIGVRWVDVNKGDEVHPEYRSRLVAKEIKTDNRTDWFAATPPLEAKKLLFMMAVTYEVGFSDKWCSKLDFIDVKKAYLQASARRDVYVQLPPEEREEGKCGKLIKAMYGTRDAAQNWEMEYT